MTMIKHKVIHRVILTGVTIQYTCDNNPVSIVVNPDLDISSWEEECDLCGSHSSVDVNIRKCPNCGKNHTITITSD